MKQVKLSELSDEEKESLLLSLPQLRPEWMSPEEWNAWQAEKEKLDGRRKPL